MATRTFTGPVVDLHELPESGLVLHVRPVGTMPNTSNGQLVGTRGIIKVDTEDALGWSEPIVAGCRYEFTLKHHGQTVPGHQFESDVADGVGSISYADVYALANEPAGGFDVSVLRDGDDVRRLRMPVGNIGDRLTVAADGTIVSDPPSGGEGDMTKAVYDENGVEANVYDRENHTGEQPIDTVTGLQDELDAKAALVHNHDDRYYTESETDDLLDAKADSVDVTAEIQAAIDALVGGAPGALDTLNEIAAALGDDANFAAAVTTALAGKSDTGHDHDARYAPHTIPTLTLAGSSPTHTATLDCNNEPYVNRKITFSAGFTALILTTTNRYLGGMVRLEINTENVTFGTEIELIVDGAPGSVFIASGTQSSLFLFMTSNGGRAVLHSISASAITAGVFDSARIPNLSAAKITTGTLATARLDVGTTTGKVAAGDDSRFLTTAEKTDLTDGGESTAHTHDARYAPTIGTLTDGATITWDWANTKAPFAVVTLGAAGRTLSVTNAIAGSMALLKVVQDATGSRTITTWPSPSKFPGGSIALSTAANAVDWLSCIYDGTNYNWQISKAFA